MNLISKLFKTISDYRRYRAAYLQISVLSDRMLADIGVARADIKAIASGKMTLVNSSVEKVTAENNIRIDNILPISSSSQESTYVCQLETFPKAA